MWLRYKSIITAYDINQYAKKVSSFNIKLFIKIADLYSNLRIKYNLNDISHDTAMNLIDEIYNNQKLNIAKVYLDTVGDPSKYEAKLKARFPTLSFKVSKKADSLYPCVSAASICAKVARDSVVKNWIFNEKIGVKSYGSGYPGMFFPHSWRFFYHFSSFSVCSFKVILKLKSFWIIILIKYLDSLNWLDLVGLRQV